MPSSGWSGGPGLGPRAKHVSGLAVRVEDPAAREALRRREYAEEARGLVSRMLILVAAQAGVLLLITASNASPFEAPTGESPGRALALTAVWMAGLFAWPVVLLVLLRAVPSPLLLWAAGQAVLAAVSGRTLAVMAAHAWAVHAAGGRFTGKDLGVLADPFAWAFVTAGVVLWVRSRRLAGDAPQAPPAAVGPAGVDPRLGRSAWGKVLIGTTAAYALALVGVAGVSRYETSAYLRQPGVDPVREQEGLLALNQAAAAVGKDDLAAAERSFQAALRVWEGLTAGRQSPATYRFNKAYSYHNLGWIRDRQGRPAEAEADYARAADLLRELAGDPEVGEDARRNLAEVEQSLAGLRGGELARSLDEKDRTAVRKYEDAVVAAPRAAADAERLCREAIALWEEVLPQATAPDYRGTATGRLSAAYQFLGELREQLGRPGEAQAALARAVE